LYSRLIIMLIVFLHVMPFGVINDDKYASNVIEYVDKSPTLIWVRDMF